MVTETLIRGMYAYWRKVMEAPGAEPAAPAAARCPSQEA
jgi:salicylate 5-hydroxylase large subunit